MSFAGKISSWNEEDGARIYRFDSGGTVADAMAAVLTQWQAEGCPANAWAASNADSGSGDWRDALVDAGFVEVFAQVEMELQLGGWKPMGPTLTARAPERHELDGLWRLNEEAYRGRPYTGVATADDRQQFSRDARDLDLWSVVADATGPVAFAAARIEGGIGWIDELSVHPSARRRGLGRGLLERSLRLLGKHDLAAVRLFTDRDDSSGARSLYEASGFCMVNIHSRFRKRLGVAER